MRTATLALALLLAAPALAFPGAASPPDDLASHFRFENADGSQRNPAKFEPAYDESKNRLTVTVQDSGAAVLYVLMERDWADRTFASIATSVEHEVVGDGNARWYRMRVDAPLAPQPIVIQSFFPSQTKQYSYGDSSTVALATRPMFIQILSLPHQETLAVGEPNTNGSLPETRTTYVQELAIDYSDGDARGQPILYDADWLRGLGFTAPEFRYADGTLIPSTSTPDGIRVEAPHFSTIYTFDTSDEGFTRESPQPLSLITWDSTNHRIRYECSRVDTYDEKYTHSVPGYTTTTSFSLTSRWATTQQGNWQQGEPIFLAAEGVMDANTDANSAYIYYYSRDSNLGQNPSYFLRYRDAGGVLRIDQEFIGSAGTEYHFYIGYSSGTHALTIKIQDAANADLSTATYTTGTNPNDGFTFNKVGVGCDGLATPYEPIIQAWVDEISLNAGPPTPAESVTLASHSGHIDGCCQFWDEGTLVTFNGVSSGAPLTVTYKYCYGGDTNFAPGHIKMLLDGTVVDDFTFLTPYTGGGTCTWAVPSTYAARTFEIQGGVSNSIRFDYANGDWRVAISNIEVKGPGPLNENFETGSQPSGWTTTGFWHVSDRRAYDGAYSLWYGQETTNNFNNGAANAGEATSPTFTVPSQYPTLTFKSWYDTEPCPIYDKKTVEVSVDGGAWTQLGDAVCDGSQMWNTETYSLAAQAGQSVRIRLKFNSVDSFVNNGQGWFVDDVVVQANPNEVPNTPSSPNPGDGTTQVSWVPTPAFTGGDPDGQSVTYNVHRRQGTSGSFSVVCTVTTTSTLVNSCPQWGLLAGSTYQWYVVATDSLGGSTTGPTWTFTTNYPPNTPNAPDPGDGTTKVPWTFTPAFNGGDQDGQSVTYEVYRRQASSGGFSNVCTVTSTSTLINTCPAWTFTMGASYEWYVLATDSMNLAVPGPTWSFTTNYLPTMPNSPTPGHTTTHHPPTVTPTFYGGDPDGQSVEYKVYGREGPGSYFNMCTVTTTSNPITTCPSWNNLGNGVTYTWYVVATDSMGASRTGPEWWFKTNARPLTCLSLSATHLGVLATNNCLDPDSDAVTYTINWGDSTTTVIGPTTSYPSIPRHWYGSAYCPSGTATVTITAQDGYSNPAPSQTQTLDINDYGHDADSDGLISCRESIQGTGDNNPDLDADGLNDYVESQWWPNRDAVFCLPGAPASCAPNPLHKDAYVEMDAVHGRGRSASDNLMPGPDMDRLVSYYGQAPLTNPDGISGIVLHLDAGSLRAGYDLKGGGDDVGDYPEHLAEECDTTFWQRYDNIENAHFSSARRPYFYYGLWLDQVCHGAGGVARNVPSREFAMQGNAGDPWRMGTFMHEFGHSLGLFHGGTKGQATYKPNYISIMNYRQPHLISGEPYYGYSTTELPTINEEAVNEPSGLGQARPLTAAEMTYLSQFQLYFACPAGYVNGEEQSRLYNGHPAGGMDFNCNGVIESGWRPANINGRTRNDKPVGTDAGGNFTMSDCMEGGHSGHITHGCDVNMKGVNDWSVVGFGGLTRNFGYGEKGPDMARDDMMAMRMGPGNTCVPLGLEGEICINTPRP